LGNTLAVLPHETSVATVNRGNVPWLTQPSTDTRIGSSRCSWASPSPLGESVQDL